MEREKFFVSASPHIHEGTSTQGLMIHVLIALMLLATVLFVAHGRKKS